MNPLTPVQIELLQRQAELTRANAQAGAMLFAVVAFFVLIVVARLIRCVLDAYPSPAARRCKRVDAALRADAAPKYLQPSTARPQRRRAA